MGLKILLYGLIVLFLFGLGSLLFIFIKAVYSTTIMALHKKMKATEKVETVKCVPGSSTLSDSVLYSSLAPCGYAMPTWSHDNPAEKSLCPISSASTCEECAQVNKQRPVYPVNMESFAALVNSEVAKISTNVNVIVNQFDVIYSMRTGRPIYLLATINDAKEIVFFYQTFLKTVPYDKLGDEIRKGVVFNVNAIEKLNGQPKPNK